MPLWNPFAWRKHRSGVVPRIQDFNKRFDSLSNKQRNTSLARISKKLGVQLNCEEPIKEIVFRDDEVEINPLPVSPRSFLQNPTLHPSDNGAGASVRPVTSSPTSLEKVIIEDMFEKSRQTRRERSFVNHETPLNQLKLQKRKCRLATTRLRSQLFYKGNRLQKAKKDIMTLTRKNEELVAMTHSISKDWWKAITKDHRGKSILLRSASGRKRLEKILRDPLPILTDACSGDKTTQIYSCLYRHLKCDGDNVKNTLQGGTQNQEDETKKEYPNVGDTACNSIMKRNTPRTSKSTKQVKFNLQERISHWKALRKDNGKMSAKAKSISKHECPKDIPNANYTVTDLVRDMISNNFTNNNKSLIPLRQHQKQGFCMNQIERKFKPEDIKTYEEAGVQVTVETNDFTCGIESVLWEDGDLNAFLCEVLTNAVIAVECERAIKQHMGSTTNSDNCRTGLTTGTVDGIDARYSKPLTSIEGDKGSSKSTSSKQPNEPVNEKSSSTSAKEEKKGGNKGKKHVSIAVSAPLKRECNAPRKGVCSDTFSQDNQEACNQEKSSMVTSKTKIKVATKKRVKVESIDQTTQTDSVSSGNNISRLALRRKRNLCKSGKITVSVQTESKLHRHTKECCLASRQYLMCKSCINSWVFIESSYFLPPKPKQPSNRTIRSTSSAMSTQTSYSSSSRDTGMLSTRSDPRLTRLFKRTSRIPLLSRPGAVKEASSALKKRNNPPSGNSYNKSGHTGNIATDMDRTKFVPDMHNHISAESPEALEKLELHKDTQEKTISPDAEQSFNVEALVADEKSSFKDIQRHERREEISVGPGSRHYLSSGEDQSQLTSETADKPSSASESSFCKSSVSSEPVQQQSFFDKLLSKLPLLNLFEPHGSICETKEREASPPSPKLLERKSSKIPLLVHPNAVPIKMLQQEHTVCSRMRRRPCSILDALEYTDDSLLQGICRTTRLLAKFDSEPVMPPDDDSFSISPLMCGVRENDLMDDKELMDDFEIMEQIITGH